MLLADTIRQFDTYLRVERNLSTRTRAAYAYELARFLDFLRELHRGAEPRLEGVTAADIKEYLHLCKTERAYRPTTMARTIASIRVLFDYAVEQEMLSVSPAQAIHNPKQAKKLPIFLAQGELKRLFEAPDRSDVPGVRDHTMLVTMAFCGLRLQELVGLDTLDIDFESRTVRVFGKGSKERIVPINPVVESALRLWLEIRPAAPGEKAVFVNKRGRRITGRSVERIMDKHVLAAGLRKARLSPHKLRHTFATLLHLNDVDLVEIQKLMGHATISSTQIYTHTNADKLRGAVEKLRIE